MSLFCVMACQDLDPIYDRLEALETDVKDLKSAVSLLQMAYSEGMVVKSVDPVEEGAGGWSITFSDNTTIVIRNGENGRDGVDGQDGADGADGRDGVDGAIPYVLVDGDGYWCSTYDHEVFTRIMDSNGAYVRASGSDGLSLSVVTTSDERYAFVSKMGDVVVDTIRTALSSDSSAIIQAISENQQTHQITVLMADGSEFVFNKEYSIPASIAILTTRRVELGVGVTSCFEFRVNPSDAVFCYEVGSDSCAIEMDLLGSNKGASTYVRKPLNYSLTKVEQVYDEQGVKKTGQYRAYVTDNGQSTSYKERAALVLTVEDQNGKEVQISSSAFDVEYCGNLLLSFSFLKARNAGSLLMDVEGEVGSGEVSVVSPFVFSHEHLVADFETNGTKVLVGDKEQVSGVSVNDFSSSVTYTVVGANGETKSYVVSVGNTGLPVVVIDTEGGAPIDQKEVWMENTGVTIYEADGTMCYQSSSDNIRGRGNSTWLLAKKPYALKLSSKSELLGMPKHKRWCLLANSLDRTLLRNDVAYEIARRTGLEYTPRGRFVEVVLNGSHVGNYYLCEQIKVDKNRVSITAMTEADTTATTISGGYLMELDVNYDEVNKFHSVMRNLPYMFKSPDEEVLTEAQFEWMKDYVNTMERSLYTESLFKSGDFLNYMDINTFVDYWLVQELAENKEAGWPKSVYFHKERDGVIKAGPVWDFDYNTFQGERSYSARYSLYYSRLFKSADFVAKVKERWASLKANLENIDEYIDSRAAELSVSEGLNIRMWPVQWQSVNNDGTLPYDEAVGLLKESLGVRIEWLDVQIQNM